MWANFLNAHTPLVMAHRGASKYAPENTLPAFRLALEQGAPAIELDVTLTRDGEIIVFHDNTLSRTTNGNGQLIEKSLADLKLLDAGAWFGKAFQGTQIPTLREVFSSLGKKIFINIELKTHPSPQSLAEQVSSLVREFKLEEYVLFSSFNRQSIIHMQNLLPQVPAGILINGGLPGRWQYALVKNVIPHQSVNMHQTLATAGIVKAIHQTGKKVFVYTVNTAKAMERLYSLKVDGLITDDPPLALQTIQRMANGTN